MRFYYLLSGLAVVVLPILAASTVQGAQISVVAGRDNTIFSESNNSAGAATTFISGRTNGGGLRRALLQFDVASAVPAQAVVTSAVLIVQLDGASQAATQAHEMTLHRITADWGEGVSGSGGSGGGQGAAPSLDDATWIHRMFDASLWSDPGGEFVGMPSAVTSVGTALDAYQWQSTPQLVADVQGWLDDPASNFGWALIGDETKNGTARRFNSREEVVLSHRPALVLEYTPVPEPSSTLLLLAGSVLAASARSVKRKRMRIAKVAP